VEEPGRELVMVTRTALQVRDLQFRLAESVAARVVWTAILTVANSIAVAIASRTIGDAITFMIGGAPVVEWNHETHTAGQKTAHGDQHDCELFHIFSLKMT
jgi:hypothetical protein